MPTAPQKPCRYPRCAGLAAPGAQWCAAHAPAARKASGAELVAKDEHRGSAASRGYDSRWREVALNFRALYPLSDGYLTCTAFWTQALAIQFATLRAAAQARGEFLRFMMAAGEGMQFLAECPIYEFHAGIRTVPGEVVDHIRPHRGDQTLFWAEWNLQAIGKQAHDEKTAKFDGGFRGAARPASRRGSGGGIA